MLEPPGALKIGTRMSKIKEKRHGQEERSKARCSLLQISDPLNNEEDDKENYCASLTRANEEFVEAESAFDCLFDYAVAVNESSLHVPSVLASDMLTLDPACPRLHHDNLGTANISLSHVGFYL